MSMKSDRIRIFEDTLNICNENTFLQSSILKSKKEQIVILENETIETSESRYKDKANIFVSKDRTFIGAHKYIDQGKIAVHNFASATNPGGGVRNGSNAQEECLCRCSTLYPVLTQQNNFNKFYIPHRNGLEKIYNDDCIYTPNIVVIKKDANEPILIDESQWFTVDIITCAAPNLRAVNRKITDKELLSIHIKRLTRILDIAKYNKVDNIILGAFGCGAFQNSPEIVARAAHTVIQNYIYDFKNIEFAVYCTDKQQYNYTVFKRWFAKEVKK